MGVPPELSEVVDFLKLHVPFDALEPALLMAAARQIEIIYLRKGEVLLTIGERNTALAVIRRGSVAIHDAQDGLVMHLAEGESYGLPSLLTGNPVRHRVTMIEDGLIYLLPLASFRAVRAADPHFDQYYVRTLEQRLRDAVERHPAHPMMATPVGMLVTRAPVMIGADASIRAAARKMSAARVSSILIGDAERVLGIVTDRDLRNRVLAQDQDPNAPVSRIMTADPVSLDVGKPVFDAYLQMVSLGIHHLPVTRDGQCVGMLTTRDLVSQQTQHPLYLVNQVHKQESLGELKAVSSRVPQMFALLLASGAGAEDVARMLSTLTDAFTRRLLKLAQARLGPPPIPFAWICFGSQARQEQGVCTDQDNGLILAHAPDALAAEYFRELSEEVCDGLNACGYPWCTGGIMARNSRWRMSLDQWRQCFANWIETPEPAALLNASIFFDQRLVAGDAELFDTLQSSIFARASAHGLFLGLLARQASAHEVPLGLFRRFVVAREGEHRDSLDLKAAGSLPLTDVLRVQALAAGIRAPGSLARIDELRSQGRIAPGDASELRAVLLLLLRLRLKHQSEQLKHALTADNWINPNHLDRHDRDALRDAFAVIRRAQAVLMSDYGIRG